VINRGNDRRQVFAGRAGADTVLSEAGGLPDIGTGWQSYLDCLALMGRSSLLLSRLVLQPANGRF